MGLFFAGFIFGLMLLVPIGLFNHNSQILGRWGYFSAGFISALALLVTIILLGYLGHDRRSNLTRPGAVPFSPAYNELLDKINDGTIDHASIRGNVVIATTKAGQIFEVWVFSPEKMAEKMVEKGIKVYTSGEEVSPPSRLVVLTNWLPLIVYVLVFWFVMGAPLYGIRAMLRRLEQATKKD
jgi:ATP-dependent Zn protease